jgi:2-oxo-3-hexenedioate decarboxylase
MTLPMSSIDSKALAEELRSACSNGHIIPTPSSRDPGFDLNAAYAVEAELARSRVAAGFQAVGWKVGYANKAVWRALKLETLVWAHMYSDTVQHALNGQASLSLSGKVSPKIEPEIVVKLKAPVGPGDAAAVLESVEWLAVGFEMIDCVFPDWKFQPADFVAAYGLHSALIVGQPRAVDSRIIASLVDQLAQFKVRLLKNGEVVDEGSGKNALRSPALCLAELAGAMSRRGDGDALRAGDLISTGTLTTSQLIEAGDTWSAEVEGVDLPGVTLRLTA